MSPFPSVTKSARRIVSPLRRRVEDVLRYAGASFFTIVALLVVVGIPLLLLLTSTYGLGDAAKGVVEEKLSGCSYTVRLGRLRFSPTSGFTVENLRMRDTTPAARLVASVDRLSISFNIQALARKDLRIESISMSDAKLDIPLGSGAQPRLQLDHVGALVLCAPEQFRVTDARFDVAGLRVHLSGTFDNPKKFSPAPVSTSGPGATARTIDAIVRELSSVRWTGEHPILSIEAGGDLSDSRSVRVRRAELRAGAGEWRGVSWRSIGLQLRYGGGILSLDTLTLDDGVGILQATGSADFPAKHAGVEFGGAFNGKLIPILALGGKRADDWSWTDPVRVSGGMTAAWNDGPPVLDGKAMIEAGRFSWKGVGFDAFSAGVALRGGKVLVRDLHVRGDPGTVDADLLLSGDDNRIRLKASLFPGKFAPAASGPAADTLGSMDFRDPLRITFEGSAPSRNPLLLKGTGSLQLGKAAMRGAWIDSLASTISLADGAAAFRDIAVTIGDGVGKGEFVYDFKNWEGRFSGIRTTLDAGKVLMWIDPHIAEGIRPYRFNSPPEVQLSGKVGLRNPEKNDLRIAVNAPAGLRYTLIGKELPFKATSGTVRLRGQELFVDIPKAALFGGNVALKAEVPVAPNSPGFGASVHLEDVDLETLTKLYFDYSESTGRLTADYAFRAVNGDDRAMSGKGNLLIKDGNVLGMPILGPLSVMMNEAVPGLGYQTARRATADFTVDNGAITTRNILIQGSGFNMIGNGKIFYLDNQMSMNMRLNMQGLPGIVLFPVSKIFEYESVGSATHPKWRPKLLPKFGSKEGAQPQGSPSPSPSASPAGSASPKQSGQ